jgi:DNA-binding CsgD family transcriptional regulator
VTDQNWKGMTEIMKKLGKGIMTIYIYIYTVHIYLILFIDLHVLFI